MKASGKLLERSGEIVSDAVSAIRSVTSFNLQAQVSLMPLICID